MIKKKKATKSDLGMAWVNNALHQTLARYGVSIGTQVKPHTLGLVQVLKKNSDLSSVIVIDLPNQLHSPSSELSKPQSCSWWNGEMHPVLNRYGSYFLVLRRFVIFQHES